MSNLPPGQDQPDEEEVKRIMNALSVLKEHPAFIKTLLKEDKDTKYRRKNYSARSHMSYYKEHYALQLKKTIDEMMLDGEPREWRMVDYPDMKKRTIYLRVNQSFLYILDCLDPDETYKKLRQDLDIHVTKTGVVMKKLAKQSCDFLAKKKTNQPPWVDQVDYYLNTSALGDNPLHLKDLTLTPEEIRGLEQNFSRAEIEEYFMAMVTHSEIKIVRVK